MIAEVYRQAFTDVLYERAKNVLCPQCAAFLESAAIDRYKLMMAKRREEISNLQTNAQKERGVEGRRRELEKQNKKNAPSKGITNE
jgi:hypothetical protein